MFVSAMRTIILYILLIVGMRFMGKRQIGQLQPSELVSTILLSELIAVPIIDSDAPLLGAIIPFALVICFEITIPWCAARFPFVKRTVDGRPSLIIHNGQINQKELLNMRLSMDELLGLLRLRGVGDIRDVQYGMLELNGQLSIILRSGANPATVDDMGISPARKGIAHPLVVQGQISDFHLELLGHDRRWLYKKLSDQGCSSAQVLLFSLDDNGNYTLIRKEES